MVAEASLYTALALFGHHYVRDVMLNVWSWIGGCCERPDPQAGAGGAGSVVASRMR